MGRMEFGEVDPDEALLMWNESPHSSVFTHPSVLSRLACGVDWHMAWKGAERICAWPICINSGGDVYVPDFAYYVGPIWSSSGYAVPAHRSLARRIEVYEGFTRIFESKYGGFRCSLPMGLDDVRVFDWWNYNDHHKPRVQISPRYTAILKGLSSDRDPVSGYRELRKREIRRISRSDRYAVTYDVSSLEMSDLYTHTMERQGLSVDDDVRNQITAILGLIGDGHGYAIGIRDELDCRRLSFATANLRAKNTSNLVLNVTANDSRGTGVSAYGIHKSIEHAIMLGDTVYDFNGANSPRRADDKHSYGAHAVLYFDLYHSTAYPGRN